MFYTQYLPLIYFGHETSHPALSGFRVLTKSPLPRSVILGLLSWSDAIWRLHLSSLTPLLHSVKCLTSSSVSGFFCLHSTFPHHYLLPSSVYSYCLPSARLSYLPIASNRQISTDEHAARLALLLLIFQGQICAWAKSFASGDDKWTSPFLSLPPLPGPMSAST